MRNYAEEIKEFYKNIWKFYNIKTGIYPIATDKKIQQAVNQYIESKPLSQIHFDSFDREQVRTILKPNYSII